MEMQNEKVTFVVVYYTAGDHYNNNSNYNEFATLIPHFLCKEKRMIIYFYNY